MHAHPTRSRIDQPLRKWETITSALLRPGGTPVPEEIRDACHARDTLAKALELISPDSPSHLADRVQRADRAFARATTETPTADLDSSARAWWRSRAPQG